MVLNMMPITFSLKDLLCFYNLVKVDATDFVILT